MFNWDSLIDASALAAVLPDEYSHFGGPVKDSLILFLSGLPQKTQVSMLAEQAGLPAGSSISKRLSLLARRCPVLHKLGQVLARDQRLAVELRRHLQTLESMPPSVSLDSIVRTLHQELGPLERLGVTVVSPPLAEASVAVVVPYEQKTRSPSPARPRGVFKVLKPGIEERLGHELGLLEAVGTFLDERCEALRIPHLDYRESFQQVRDKLLEEVRLDHEQRHLKRARTFYAHDSRVQIPTVLEHCTHRVTAMEWVSGGKVTEQGSIKGSQNMWLAQQIVRSLIAEPIFSTADEAMFHSDPHAGNLFLTTDNRLAILDWSLVGTLGPGERAAMVQIMLAALTIQPRRIAAILNQLAVRNAVDSVALESIVQSWLARMRHGQFPGLAWLIGMLDEAVQLAGLRLSTNLMLFRKTLHTLGGVLAEMGAGSTCVDKVLCMEFLRRFAIEWPTRWFAPPNSRSFSTRLSNLDLTGAMLDVPFTGVRYWTGQTQDLMRAVCETRT